MTTNCKKKLFGFPYYYSQWIANKSKSSADGCKSTVWKKLGSHC